MSESTCCMPEQLNDFVEDRLGPQDQRNLIEHLDLCEQCRAALSAAAGSDECWDLAARALCEPADDEILSSPSGGTFAERHSRSGDAKALLQWLAPSEDPRAAGRIGPFEVVGIVGSGGMGIVLKARDPALDRYVAIKVLAPHLASSASAQRRFAREARAAAAVIHDNVIAIYQVSSWQDLPYLVMPYVPDPSLAQRLESDGRLDLESTLSIGLQIARGLDAAHAQGLVHRDVKPANVLLCKGTERAIITDFGLARASDDASLTRAGALTGTPHYMSPEQARGESVDQRSDLFSLGSVLFAMQTGRPPVDYELGSETIAALAEDRLPSLREIDTEIPTWFCKLVDCLHQADPVKRPSAAREVAELLEQCLAHVRQPFKTPVPEQLLVNSRRRQLSLLASVVAGFAVPLALTAVLWWFSFWPFVATSRKALRGKEAARVLEDSAATNDRFDFKRSVTPGLESVSVDHGETNSQEWNSVNGDIEELSSDLEQLFLDVEHHWQFPIRASRSWGRKGAVNQSTAFQSDRVLQLQNV